MSKLTNASTKRDTSHKNMQSLKQKVIHLEQKQKENDFVVKSLKAEIRLLRDTLCNIKNTARDALNTEDIMFEALNSNIENSNHLKHDGEEIFYPGEEKKK